MEEIKNPPGGEYLFGHKDSDRFVIHMPALHILLIGEYESEQYGVKRTIRVERLNKKGGDE
jgi:hypothetical protein